MLNKGGFKVVAGSIVTPDGGPTELLARQRWEHSLGFQEAELCRSIYGWGVRNSSGLDGWSLLYSSTNRTPSTEPDGGLGSALAWSNQWVNAAPGKRQVYIRRSAVDLFSGQMTQVERDALVSLIGGPPEFTGQDMRDWLPMFAHRNGLQAESIALINRFIDNLTSGQN